MNLFVAKQVKQALNKIINFSLCLSLNQKNESNDTNEYERV